MRESDILFERGPFWVCAAPEFDGFEVWQNAGTSAKRVARIGYTGQVGIEKAKLEIARRFASDPWLSSMEVTVEGVTYLVECGKVGWSITCGGFKTTETELLEAARTITGARKFFS